MNRNKQKPQQSQRRRASDWYVPLSLVVSVIGTLVGVQSLLSPLLASMIDVNYLHRPDGTV